MTLAPPTASSANRLLEQGEAFAAELAQWFVQHRRALPWREQPSPYKTVVSELMLQQTQVVTVLPYFERWLARWPDFAALAAAEEAQVLQMWEGLGYYSRARNLLKLARAWVAAEEKPVTAEQWLAYPGVGPYTAAAIASIAFGEHAAVVDGNVVRILTRLSADTVIYPSAAHAVKAQTPLAQAIITHVENPGLHNEAMMELGATLCRKGQSQCLLCPVVRFCGGQKLGQELETLPRITRKKTQERLVNRAFVMDAEREAVLLWRYGGASRRLAGLCELPLWEAVAPQGSKKLSAGAKPLLVRRRGIANERIEERFYALAATPQNGQAVCALEVDVAERVEALSAQGGLFWQKLDALGAVTLTGPHRRWLSQLLERA